MSEPLKGHSQGSTHHKANQAHKHNKHHNRHARRPCPCPPAAPTSIALTYQKHQQEHHLKFYAKVKWAMVTADQCGHPIPGGGVKLDHYEIELQPTDIAGVPAQTEDAVQGQNVPHMKRKLKKVPAGLTLTAATTAVSVATFTTSTVHGFAINDIVKVTGVHPFAYNGDWKVLSVPTTTTFTANIGSTPAAGNTFGLVEGPPDPSMNIIFTHIPNPKKWYWRARVRVWDDNQCASFWSAWTAPSLPYTGSTTQPPAPGGVVLTFDKVHKMRHAHLAAVVTWNEVINWDTGLDKESDMGHYQIELAKSDDGAAWDTHPRTKHRAAKPNIDADHAAAADTPPTFDGGADTLDVRFNAIHRKYFYRARVRAIARHHVKGPWSAWSPGTGGVTPSDATTPPVPTNLTLNMHQHKAVVRWDDPDESAQTWSYTPGGSDAVKTDIVHEDIAFFQIQLDTNVLFNTANLQFDRFQAGQHKVFRVTKPISTGPNWFARVRSVSATYRVSAWVTTASTNLLTVPAPATPSVVFDQLGPRHTRARALVTAATVSVATHDDDIHSYQLEVAIAATNANPPPGGAARRKQRMPGDGAGDELIASFGNIKRDFFFSARERAFDKEGKHSAWSAWSTPTQPTAGTPTAPSGIADASTHKLVGIRWDTPMAEDTPTANRPDESISHYHVQVATTNLFTVLLDEAKHITHRQHRWKDTSPGTARFARVRSVDSLGGVSAWQPGATGLSVTAGDDGVPIGHIQKVHHAVATPPALTTGSFLWCNGAAVSRTTFAALFAVISTTAGAGDGATTFNLPDHRGKHALGVSTHATAGHRTLGARDDADTSGIKVDHAHDVHGGDTHPDTDDHAPGVGQLNVSASDNPESGHVHNASNISIGASFGNVQAGTQAAQAAGPNHGHGASGFTGTLQFAHQHGISTGWGGRHPWLGQHPGKPQHGANNAPWLAVHYIIKAL